MAGKKPKLVVSKMGAPGSLTASDGGALVAYLKKRQEQRGKFAGIPGRSASGMGNMSDKELAYKYEREEGSGDAKEKLGKLRNHLAERPGYYRELVNMLDVDNVQKGQNAEAVGGTNVVVGLIRKALPEAENSTSQSAPKIYVSRSSVGDSHKEQESASLQKAVGTEGIDCSDQTHQAEEASTVARFVHPSEATVSDQPFCQVRSLVKSQLNFQGIPIVIEYKEGDERKWKNSKGESGSTTMQYPYGYVKGVKGADGEEVDVYIGPDETSQTVYVINQRRIGDKRAFDEHKIMLGFSSEAKARSAYVSNFSPRSLGTALIGSVRTWTIEKFKKWLKNAPKSNAVSKSGPYGFAGQRGNWRALPLVAPIAGSAPRNETPALPDYQGLYFQPKSSDHRKREAAQVTNRRRADAKRVSGVFGFHGEGKVELNPVLKYSRPNTDPVSTRSAKKYDENVKERRDAGKRSQYQETDAGRTPRSPDRRDDTLASIYGRKVPVKDDVDADEKKDARKRVKVDAKGKKRYSYYLNKRSAKVRKTE